MFTPDDNLEILKGGLEGPKNEGPDKPFAFDESPDWEKIEARVLGRPVADGDIPVVIDKRDKKYAFEKCYGYRGPLPDFKPHPGAQADFMQLSTTDKYKAWIDGHWVTPSWRHRLWCWLRMHKKYVAGYTWGRIDGKAVRTKVKSCLNCNYGGTDAKKQT